MLAVFVPSLVLAWLAVRSLRDQQFLLERQQSLLYQGIVVDTAKQIRDILAEDQHEFVNRVAALLRDRDSRQVARSFDELLHQEWPLAQVGFVVTSSGDILSPSRTGRPEASSFYVMNSGFLANRETAEVYRNNVKGANGGFGNSAGNYNGMGQPAGQFANTTALPEQQQFEPNASPQSQQRDGQQAAISRQTPAQVAAPSIPNPPSQNPVDTQQAQVLNAPAAQSAQPNPSSAQTTRQYDNGTWNSVGQFNNDLRLVGNGFTPFTNTLGVNYWIATNWQGAILVATNDSNGNLALVNAYNSSKVSQRTVTPLYQNPGRNTTLNNLRTTDGGAQQFRPANDPVGNWPQTGVQNGFNRDNQAFQQKAGPPATNAPAPNANVRQQFELNSANSVANSLNDLFYVNINLGQVQDNVQSFQQGQGSQAGQASDINNNWQYSKVAASEAEFRQLIGDDSEGTLARYVDNKLNVLFWCRAPQDPGLIFGASVALPHLIENLSPLLEQPDLQGDICVALLDDLPRPVALSHPGFHAAWKHPLVSEEVGECLPKWEVAVYPLDPNKLTKSAQTLKLTLSLLIGVLLLAIGVGSWLIVADLNRHLTLARQKTDFVSNVSHELKTPLTSIRMFSELLADGRVKDPSRQVSYLNIITSETARLTRLINNVLDFSRLERGEKKYHFQKCDLAGVVRETAESYRPHLEANGFKFDGAFPESPVHVNGDRDALAQVLVNLLSNAEKYSDGGKEVAVRVSEQAAPLPMSKSACWTAAWACRQDVVKRSSRSFIAPTTL